LAYRREGVVINLAAGDNGDFVVKEAHKRANEPRLGLAALAEEDDVLAGENGVLQVRQDGVLVANDPREVGLALLDAPNEVLAHLLLYSDRFVTGVAQLSNGLGLLLYHCGSLIRRAASGNAQPHLGGSAERDGAHACP